MVRGARSISGRPSWGDLPHNYAERIYAGVLGKIIGVYLGRPFEGWSYERIGRELGEVDSYVNERMQRPLIVTDDDISGTFTFVRAFADYGYDPGLSPRQIGETWLNYLIEHKTILWWGGMGNSTEHTAYLRLKRGIPAPQSGAIAGNSKVVAEQIGAQIFIDGWAMLCPGDPERAADYARRAGSVSHDGEAIYGAQVVAAIEAGAFVEPDLTKLTDEALRLIPRDSIIARLIADLREWHAADGDWRRTFSRIQARYGYDTYTGNCHVVPNHALIHLGLLYGGGDFGRSLLITNTAGWDTDCNSGNVGCILGIRNGLATFEGDPDWRGPVADRMLISSADGGRGITDAVLETRHLVSTAQALSGLPPSLPTDRTHFDFALPGSVQGWQPASTTGPTALRLENVAGHNASGQRSLALRFVALAPGQAARAGSATFIPPETLSLGGYSLQACPTLYGGQTVRARVAADAVLQAPLTVRLYLRRYADGPLQAPGITLEQGPATRLAPGAVAELSWSLPPGDGAPIFEVGLELASDREQSGAIYLDELGWTGSPEVHWRRPAAAWPASVRAWVAGADVFQSRQESLYNVVQNSGRGLAIMGKRDWADYTLAATVRPHMAKEAGIAARVQGMERYYALLLTDDGYLRLLKRAPGERQDGGVGERLLEERPLDFALDHPYHLALNVEGGIVTAWVDGEECFRVIDNSPLLDGAIALLATEGRVDIDDVTLR